MKRNVIVFGMVICALLAMGVSAKADLLDLTIQKPDIFSDYIYVEYNAASGLLSASGFAETYDPDGVPANKLIISEGDWVIQANIDQAGVASGGLLTITGTLGSNTSPLLTGTLSDFGYSAVGQEMEFVFQATGGSLLQEFGGLGMPIGVKLHGTGFGGSFASSFNNDSFGTADTAPVPEPASLALLLAGAGLLTWRRRRA